MAAALPAVAIPTTNYVPLTPSHHTADIQQRQATWIQSRWVQGPVALAAGVAVQGKQTWKDMINTCQEFSNSHEVESGVDCVFDAMLLAVRVGISTQGVYSGAQGVANAFTGQTKRDGNSTDSLASTLIAMSSEAIDALQPLVPNIEGLSLVNISYGSPDLDNSIALDFGVPDVGVQVRHVTNGTHGFAQASSNNTEASSDLSKRDTYSFAADVAGLKFSYSKPCSDNNYYDSGDEGQGMRSVLYNFAYWSAYTQTADKYILEFYNPGNANRLYAVGTMIAETSGFANNYEGFPYETDRGC
ncbi:hypothetical protein K431DRAFT_301489 [Polychaeton citri CBS 116435]|uniref:Uncharacterized protein n=1 Tax=Polychaeton citri CBS 116435 TaxID=1314669 RepID=A0A9P4QCW2_9PEZI|nr:hypothetical protein K431DRAFT_301489 [Polychaeton citri CBS 116435]